MSDDLIKRLRSKTPNMVLGHAAMEEAADRIEELERERERVIKASNDMFCVMSDNLNTAQDKLDKALDLAVYAVNALDEIQTYEQPDDPWTENALTMGELDAFDFNVATARDTLKELGVDMV